MSTWPLDVTVSCTLQWHCVCAAAVLRDSLAIPRICYLGKTLLLKFWLGCQADDCWPPAFLISLLG